MVVAHTHGGTNPNFGLSLFTTHCDSIGLCNSVSASNRISSILADNNQSEGSLGASPNLPCKVCFYTGHLASQRPFRVSNHSDVPSAPYLATI